MVALADDIHDPDKDDGPRPTRLRRPVRSFVRREGRLTPAQARALRELWPRYGVDHPGGMLDPERLYGRVAPLTLEIGFGNGEVLLQAASRHPDSDFLGIEVHRPGVGRLLNRAAERELRNLRVVCADAAQVVRERLPAACLDAGWIFFPDPWPKKRHHKRRLVQPGFARVLAERLKAGGILHLATDWGDYAAHMLQILDAEPLLENDAGPGRYARRPQWRPATRFEERGRSRGHAVHDLIYRRTEHITP